MKSSGDRDLKDLAILSWVVCAFAICLLLIFEGRRDAKRDFVYFYSVGRIANDHPPEQIYNLNLQQKTFAEVFRLEGDRAYGPSPYPPFVPLFFRPFSLLSFETAYRLWQACTLFLLCTGVGLLASAVWPKQRLVQSLLFAAAISFPPFLVDTLAGGQLAAIGCFAFCLALYEQGRAHPFRAGLALSLGLYKPTLLLLVVPMLLVRRQWRILAGMTMGGACLLASVTMFMGVRVWTSYLHMLLSLGHVEGLLDFSRYVDVVAFSTLLSHGRPVIEGVLLAGGAMVLGSFLVRVWLRSNDVRLVWATTITCTLLLNVYVPIYDCILLIPSLIWSAPALLMNQRRGFTLACLLIFGVSCISESIARTTGIQPLSLAVMFTAMLQIRTSIFRSAGTKVLSSSGRIVPDISVLTRDRKETSVEL